MAVNFDNITEKYEALASGTSSAWEVYSGERADAIAEENSIPEEKWLDDCAAMQAGQEIVAEELAKGVPQTAQEREARLRGVISRQISGLLRGQSDDVARRGALLHALQTASDFQLDDDRVAELSRLDLDTLQDKVVDAAMNLTMNIALPVMQQKCQEAAQTVQEPEQRKEVLDNPGALAVAGYMEEPELRQMPAAVGACAETVSCCYAAGSQEGNLDEIAHGFLFTAAILVCFSLMVLTNTVAASAAATVVESMMFEAGAGICATIAEGIALASDWILIPLVLALGAAAIAGLEWLVNKFAEDGNTNDYTGPIHHPTGPIVSV